VSLTVDPLDGDEEALWRALAEVVQALPRALDDRFARETGLTMTEYSVLVALSEAPDRELRLSHLATATSLSLSRISRVVDSMEKRALVDKCKSDSDGRSSLAALTDTGLRTLQAAYPGHLARVRRFVFDHLEKSEVAATMPVLQRIAEGLRDQ
jgi:DNA-binding MarR family transcriptional regulator